MKIIDLLNMISKGEEVPKKIKVGNKIYNYETFNIGKGDNYFTAEWKEVKGYRANYDGTYYYLEIRDYNLNDEVEILEEEPRDMEVCGSLFTKSEYDKLAHSEEDKKIPEKLDKYAYISDNLASEWSGSEKKLKDKINEIIDFLKSKGDE